MADKKDAKNGKAAKAPKEKAPAKPVEIPKVEDLEGPAKEEFQTVLTTAKAYMDAFKAAKAVPASHLRGVRRAITVAQTQDLKGRAVDPMIKKRDAILKRIEKAKKALAELGA